MPYQQAKSLQCAATYSAPVVVLATTHTSNVVLAIRFPANMRPHAPLAGGTAALEVVQEHRASGALLVEFIVELRKVEPAFELVRVALDPQLAGHASWPAVLAKGGFFEFAKRFEGSTMLAPVRHVYDMCTAMLA